MAIYTKCPACRKKIPKGMVCECRKERYKEYDKRVRYQESNKKYAEFYNSKAWHKMIIHINKKYNGLCLMCLFKYKEVIASDVIHHIEPIKDDYSKRLEEDNLIPLCHSCHNNIDHVNYTKKLKAEHIKLLELYYEIYI